MRAAALFLFGVLLGHLLYPSGDPVTVRAAVPDSRVGNQSLWFEPSLESPAGRLQGGAGDSVGWGAAEEPARPPFVAGSSVWQSALGQEVVGSNPTPLHQPLSAQQITALARVVTRSAAFSEWIGPVAYCESTGRATATGKAGEVGLLQVHPIWVGLVEEMGYEWDDLYEPEVNIAVAYEVWKIRGSEAWSCR